MKDFTGKVVVITGAGSGMGRAYAVEAAARGAALALNDISAAELDETRKLLPDRTRLLARDFDVSSCEAMDAFTADVLDDLGAPYLVINNAGIEGEGQPVWNTSYESFERLMRINYFGVVNGTRAFLPHLLAQDAGAIVNVSSIFGLVGPPNHSDYSASKFAVRGFTEALAAELLGTGVKAYTIHPGGIATNIARAENTRAFKDKYLTTSADDIVKVVLDRVGGPRTRIVYGNRAGSTWLGARLLPQRLMNRLTWRDLSPILDKTAYPAADFLRRKGGSGVKSFDGKVAIVTGGGGTGIGNSLVNALADRGATVAFCDIANLDVTEKQLTAKSATYYAEQVEMADKRAIDAFVGNVLERFGQVDLLINNAGIALGDLTFGEVSEADFEKITAINYWGVVHTTQRCYPHLLERPESAIVNISSSQGILGLPYLVPYCTTKFAVRGFTDALRAEHRIRGVKNLTLHTVHPGAVATNITLNADHHNGGTQQFHEMLQKGTSPADAAKIILRGVERNTGRIFISDGRMQDVLARLLPTANTHVVRAMMRLRGLPIR